MPPARLREVYPKSDFKKEGRIGSFRYTSYPDEWAEKRGGKGTKNSKQG